MPGLTESDRRKLTGPDPDPGPGPWILLAPVERGREWGSRRVYPYLGGRYDHLDSAYGELQRIQSCSASMALHVQGWDLLTVSRETWHENHEAPALSRRALNMFTDHGHGSDRSRATRESCGACCLGGYQPQDTSYRDGRRVAIDGPNYGSWPRLYVQAGRAIPRRWAVPFLDELAEAWTPGEHTQNLAWANGLRLDVATFGIVWADR